jgi:hypothetical protein
MTPEQLVGKSYTFEDGNKIEVIQSKKTDEDRGGHLITYNITQGPSIPRKLVMRATEFINTFGHLFKE